MKTLFILFSICFFASASAQEVTKFHAKVRLTVSANDAIKGEITSFMSRELRELSDVTIVDDNPLWEIDVVAMELSQQNGQKSAIVISAVMFQHYDPSLFDMVFEKKQAETARNLTKGLVSYPNHYLRGGSPEDLKTLCQKIIADFDSKHLASARKDFSDVIKTFKQYEQTKKNSEK